MLCKYCDTNEAINKGNYCFVCGPETDCTVECPVCEENGIEEEWNWNPDDVRWQCSCGMYEDEC